MDELKAYVVKLIDVQTGEIHYFEGQAESTEEALAEVMSYLPDTGFDVHTIFEEVVQDYTGSLH